MLTWPGAVVASRPTPPSWRMATTKSSALNAAALFTGGAFVGAALYTVARSLVQASITKTPKSQDKLVEAPKAPGPDQDEQGLYVAPFESDAASMYDVCGVMGQPYEPRSAIPAVQPQDTHVDLGTDTTLVSDVRDLPNLSKNMLTLSLLVMEMLALEYSGTIFTYESSSTGFGAFCESQHDKRVIPMQTRAGAGQAVVGFVAGQGSSGSAVPNSSSTVSVLTNAAGFLAMGPSLATIPADNTDLVVHVSGINQGMHDDLRVANDYASALSTAAMLSDVGYEVVLSASRQEAIDVAHYAYTRKTKRAFVHIFDGAYAACERSVLSPPSSKAPEPCTYTGPSAPATALVMPHGAMSHRARALLLSLPPHLRGKVGIVSVRRLGSWDAAVLRRAVPTSVQTLRVVEEAFSSTDGALYADVLESVLSGALRGVRAQSLVLAPGQALCPEAWLALLSLAAEQATPFSLKDVLARAAAVQVPDLMPFSNSHLVTFVGTDAGVSVPTAELLARSLFNASKHVRMLSRYDNYAAGGAVRSDVLMSERPGVDVPMDVLARDGTSHVVVVSEPASLLPGYRVLEALRQDGTLVLNAANWTPEDVQGALCAADKALLASKRAKVVVIDAQDVAQTLLSDSKARGSAADVAPAVLLSSVAAAAPYLGQWVPHTHQAQPVRTDGWSTKSDEVPERQSLSYNGVRANTALAADGGQVVRASWALAAWQLMFREAYGLEEAALRPDLPEKTYNVRVAVNKRLTPLDYDRYLFHMELDTTGTGLRYEVGEALGVHGWNDEHEVSDFVRWCGFHPDELVYVPSVTRPGSFETRTVFQTLQQNLDIFGKPPKSFFEALGKIVESRDEARWLRFISSGEGNSTFKKLSDLETVTYVDVMHMFPTARVTMDWLVKNVEPIKPRHYSIASAQAAVGDSVHLLIVTVDWKTPHGSPRFGQCTRYLSALKPGSMVTVSLKPSVMKLPPLDTQPIIMAGLGTGAAPFRAFLQARALKKSQGIEVGPMYYYFGSRHRSMEYLYGEELEAYLHDGLLTHLGLAFSRDQKKKVYIQHKIIEDGRQLVKFLVPDIDGQEVKDGDKGIFTLCGPVWPVPDIQEALVQAFSEYGWSREKAENKIAELKDDERYVLEVY